MARQSLSLSLMLCHTVVFRLFCVTMRSAPEQRTFFMLICRSGGRITTVTPTPPTSPPAAADGAFLGTRLIRRSRNGPTHPITLIDFKSAHGVGPFIMLLLGHRGDQPACPGTHTHTHIHTHARLNIMYLAHRRRRVPQTMCGR